MKYEQMEECTCCGVRFNVYDSTAVDKQFCCSECEMQYEFPSEE